MSKEESGTFTIAEKKKKKKVIIITCVVIAVVIALAFVWSAIKKKEAIQEISTEAEFIEFFEDGFPIKTTGDDITTYVLENDITITRTDLQNKDMKQYSDKIASGDSSEDEARITNGCNDTIIFDGKGHTIKNLTLTGYCASLFGKVGTNASSKDGNITIKNVTFDNLTINGIGSTGALISYLNEGSTATFENVKIINSSISSTEDEAVGGLIGVSNKGQIKIVNCSIENSKVIAENATNVGGIIGSVHNHANPAKISTIGNCKNINTEVKGLKSVGGVVGEYKDDWFSGKDANGKEVDEDIIEFKGLENSGKIYASDVVAGGVIGNLSLSNDLNITFDNCKTQTAIYESTNTTVYAHSNVGGILGSTSYNGDALVVATGSQITFKNCENNQMVYGGENIGGIVGYLNDKFWNIKFIDSTNNKDVKGTTKVGGIAGTIAGTIYGGEQFSFTNCKNTRSAIGNESNSSYIGGILGYNDNLNPLFTNCKNIGDVSAKITGKSYIGGISGRYGTFVDCENSMDIKSDTQLSWENVGGIVGSGEGSTFTNCSNSGNIIDHTKSTGVTASYIGGIAGYTNQLVMNGCSNTGTIAGTDCVGGLVGKSDATWGVSPKNTLINCSNTGNVYAFGQSSTTTDNYTNDNADDVKGKIGLIIGSFHSGTLIFEFTNVIVNGNIYVVKDTDYVGGWCGYFAEGDVNTLKNGITNSTIEYQIFLSQNISENCATNIKYGNKIFEDETSDFNNPTSTSLDTFTYSEE